MDDHLKTSNTVAVLENAALLVIDVQKGLFGRATPVFHSNELIQNICMLMEKDYHKQAAKIISEWNQKLSDAGAELVPSDRIQLRMTTK